MKCAKFRYVLMNVFVLIPMCAVLLGNVPRRNLAIRIQLYHMDGKKWRLCSQTHFMAVFRHKAFFLLSAESLSSSLPSCFHVLFSALTTSLFHSVFTCSVRAVVLHSHICTLSLHFHREMKWLQICTQRFPQEAASLLTFRSLNSQRQNNLPRASWLPANLSSSSVQEYGQERAVTKSSLCLQPAVPM